MTPTYLNKSPSQLLVPNPQASSSSSLSCHIILNVNSTSNYQNGCYHMEVQQPEHQVQAENFGSHGGSYDIENEDESGLKFSIWKKEDRNENQSESNQVKWMSSKMRLVQKMKNSDRTGTHTPITSTAMKLEDQKQPSPSLETDYYSNSSSNNPIRVCADCNTTKTPLWRSGPQGPKSLCNACGIRQRKARRAMAAAAAGAAATANGSILPTETSPTMKTKFKLKDKRSNTGQVSKYKKRRKLTPTTATSSHAKKKLCFEDFLLSLRKNLAFHRVFPQDEKEAAILLMALSCAHLHG